MKKKRLRGLLAFLCGAALILWGVSLLWTIPDTMIYVIDAPIVTANGGELGKVCAQAQAHLDEVTALNETQRGTVAARIQHRNLSTDTAGLAATVYAVGVDYLENHYERLLCGRFIGEYDMKQAKQSIVLDERAALALFSESEPIGRTLSMDGMIYEVAGVIRSGRRIGEADAHLAYIPLATADRLAMQPSAIELTAPASENVGQSILLRDTLKLWQPDGSFYNLAKEKLGAVMPLRLFALLFGSVLLLSWLNRWNIRTWNQLSAYIVELRTRYVRDLLPAMLCSGLWIVIGYAALIGFGFLLAKLFTYPLTIFSEWVPEVIVEISSIKMRFWTLADEAAAAVRYLCRDACCTEMAKSLILWGTLSATIGLFLHHVPFLTEYRKAAPLPKRY